MMHPALSVGFVAPQQQAVGLSPIRSRTIEHAVDSGPPFMPAITPSPPAPTSFVALVTPLMTVVQVSGGVAIFGAAGGRAVIP